MENTDTKILCTPTAPTEAAAELQSGPSQQSASDMKEAERVVEALNERLDSHNESRKEIQDKLHEMCEGWKKQIDSLEDKINSDLSKAFTEEDRRLQAALNNLQAAIYADERNEGDNSDEKREDDGDYENKTTSTRVAEALQKAKAELLVMQKYDLNERTGYYCSHLSEKLSLTAHKTFDTEWLDRPNNVKVSNVFNIGKVFVSFKRNT